VASAGSSSPPEQRPRRSTRLAAVAALALALLIGACAWRLITQAPPALVIHRTLASYVRLEGPRPVLAWPPEGEAAVEVEGVGSFGVSGSTAAVPIASLAKVMTAYVTLLEHPLAAGSAGFVMVVDRADAEEQRARAELGESTVPVSIGEHISERQALQALLLPSANNIAAMLADEDAGGVAAFLARMNAAARGLGMSSTTYTDPSGFDRATVSTAADQLKLAAAAMSVPAFAATVDESSAALPLVGAIANYASLVGRDGYVGVKTGSDRAAGGCFMFAKRITVAGRPLTVLGVVLSQRGGPLIATALGSAQRLGDSAAGAVRLVTALPRGESVLTVTASNGRHTSAVTSGTLQRIGWPGLQVALAVTPGPAISRLRAGERVARVSVGGTAAARSAVPAVAGGALAGPSLGWRLRHLL